MRGRAGSFRRRHAIPNDAIPNDARRREIEREKTENLATMPEVLFPEKWWRLSHEEYNEARIALKALIAKDPDSGNAEVRSSTKGREYGGKV